MANLASLSRIQSARGRIALGILLLASPLVRFLDQQSAFELDATDFQYKPEDASEGIQNRTLGGGYNASNMVPGSPIGSALAFHGTSVDVDRSHRADEERGLRLVDVYLDKRFRSKMRKWSIAYEQKLTRGNPAVTPGDVKGLRTILDGTVLPGFQGFTGITDPTEVLAGNPNSFDLSNPDNWDAFIEAMEEYTQQVEDPNGILVSPQLRARMTTIARRKHILGEARDAFGRPIPTFNDLPLIRLRKDSITHTEPDKAGVPVNNTTSLYIVSAGETRYSVVTNSGLDFRDIGEVTDKESERMTWEIRSQNKVEEENSVLRVRYLRV